MKWSQIKIAPRFSIKENVTDGIINYDLDNAYPQRVYNLINTSGIAKRCVETYAKFIAGAGFQDLAFQKIKLNRRNLTAGKLLAKTAKDLAYYNGFAIHFNYNLLGQITEANVLKFGDCRRCVPDDTGYVSHIAVYDDWWRKKSSKIDRKKIKKYHIFNPDPAVVIAQIQEAGTIQDYTGQIMWFSVEEENYPLAPVDAELEAVETDGRISNFNRKSIATAFSHSAMLVAKGKYENEEEKAAVIKDVESFQGDDEAGNVMVVFAENDDQVPEIIPFTGDNTDKKFEVTVKNTWDRIRRVFSTPTVLLGDAQAGALGLNQQILQATEAYNMLTIQERMLMEEQFGIFIPHFATPVNPSGNYKILPANFELPKPAGTPAAPAPVPAPGTPGAPPAAPPPPPTPAP